MSPDTPNPTPPTVVVVPGLRDHVEDHWQTLLARDLAADGLYGPERVRTIAPVETDRLDLDARVAAIDSVLDSVDGPVVLVAHSAGVVMTAHWAARATAAGVSRVVGALLATPPDFDVDWPAPHPRPAELVARGWAPVPRRRLPFPSILIASRNDPLARFRTTSGLAEVWGSRLVDAGEVGHLNPAAGFGRWEDARRHLDTLVAATVGEDRKVDLPC